MTPYDIGQDDEATMRVNCLHASVNVRTTRDKIVDEINPIYQPAVVVTRALVITRAS